MDNLYEILRRYEFDKTEPETLTKLVAEAVEKGGAAREELKALAQAAQTLAKAMLEKGLVSSRSRPGSSGYPPIAGIDGSCQQVGGIGGRWYVPISCAIVKALTGDISRMEVEVVAAIETIQQKQFQNVGADVEKTMLTVETKAITSWAQRAPSPSYVLLDGPVIDPPSERDKAYVNLRAAAITACLSREIAVVGCAKRSFDRTFCDLVQRELGAADPQLGALICQFPSDSHLMVFVMSYIARLAPAGSYFLTRAFLQEENEVARLYREHGLRVFLAYLQRDMAASVLRIEVPVKVVEGTDVAPADVPSIADLCASATYPGHHVPLPVHVAHEKCNIRRGCADVLYEEIMTQARASDPLEQMVLAKLR